MPNLSLSTKIPTGLIGVDWLAPHEIALLTIVAQGPMDDGSVLKTINNYPLKLHALRVLVAMAQLKGGRPADKTNKYDRVASSLMEWVEYLRSRIDNSQGD